MTTASVSTTAAASSSSMKHPSVSPLYFLKRQANQPQQHHQQQQQQRGQETAASAVAVAKYDWPCEIWHKCLMEYGDWGDVARLSCVQSSWKTLLWDAAHVDDNAKWQCANAMLDGTHGMQVNVAMAVQLLQELAIGSDSNSCNNNNNDMDWKEFQLKLQQQQQSFDRTVMPEQIPEFDSNKIINDNDDNDGLASPYRAAAMRRMAELYLSFSCTTTSATLPLLPTTTTMSTAIHSTTENNVMFTGIMWLQAAFELGHDVTAAHDLALLYERGYYQSSSSNNYDDNKSETIPIDVVASGYWYYKAACAGHVESMAELALLYELGIGGMPSSEEHALFWYRHAALRDHTTAKYSVGEWLEEARGGVPHSDVEEACLWYYRAALDGDEDGKLALRRLADVAVRMRLMIDDEDEEDNDDEEDDDDDDTQDEHFNVHVISMEQVALLDG